MCFIIQLNQPLKNRCLGYQVDFETTIFLLKFPRFQAVASVMHGPPALNRASVTVGDFLIHRIPWDDLYVYLHENRKKQEKNVGKFFSSMGSHGFSTLF